MVYIVIPVYNVLPYLARCLDSVLAQEEDYRAVLVDDGSTDGSGELCDRYAAAHPGRFEVLHQQNGGLSAARNAGIARCFARSPRPEEDFLLLLDSDDFLRRDFLSYTAGACRSLGCDGVQVGWLRGTADRFPPGWQPPAPPRLMTGGQALLDPAVKTSFCNKLYRLSLYRGEAFPVGKLNEDEFLFYRILWKCRRFALSGEPLYYYYQRPGSIMHAIAHNLRDNPHRRDWREAFQGRIDFFTALGERRQVQRTYERICIELILRYTEQMQLPRDRRDREAADGTMVRDYRACYPRMIGLDTIRPLRRLVYTLFYLCPPAAAAAARVHPLRR